MSGITFTRGDEYNAIKKAFEMSHSNHDHSNDNSNSNENTNNNNNDDHDKKPFKLKRIIKYLLSQPFKNKKYNLEFVAFLANNKLLNCKEIGEFLFSYNSSVLDHDNLKKLVFEFMQLLNFQQNDKIGVIKAFEYFVTDCNIGLPRAAHKIFQLVTTFSIKFDKDNPNMFDNSDQILLLIYGLMMLQTEKNITKEMFVTMMQDSQLKTDFIHNVYDYSIANPFKYN